MRVRELLEMNGSGARLLAIGKNTMGRCSLHIAVLREHPDIVRYIAKTYPETLRIGDNVSFCFIPDTLFYFIDRHCL